MAIYRLDAQAFMAAAGLGLTVARLPTSVESLSMSERDNGSIVVRSYQAFKQKCLCCKGSARIVNSRYTILTGRNAIGG